MLPAGAKPVCAEPKWLPVVDAAFERPRSEAAWRLADGACRHCPVFDDCLHEGMTNAVHGPWGGNNLARRVKRGAPHPKATTRDEAPIT